jgi:hypothetical protein
VKRNSVLTDRARLVIGTMLVLGCAGRLPGPTMPVAMATVSTDSVAVWVETTRPTVPIRIHFGWRLQDGRGATPGPGSATLIRGDSLRADFRLPLGAGSGALALVGDRGLWAEPEEDVRRLIPNYHLLWAMLGQARLPQPGDSVRAFTAGDLVAWQYINGADTTEYLLGRGVRRELVVDVRVAGQRLGRVYTIFGDNGLMARSRLDIPSPSTRLELTYRRSIVPDTLPTDFWTRPSDAP